MQDILVQALSELKQQSLLEVIAVILALAYVWLAARQSIWCWPCALVSTAIYTYLFWEVSLPFHTVLNVYYLIMAVYGWTEWQKQQEYKTVRQYSPLLHLGAIAGLAGLSAVLGLLATRVFSGDYMYLDAGITVFSVFATVLVAHKIRANWLYWLGINAVAVYLYLAKGLALTALLFVLYTLFAAYGYWQWGKLRVSSGSALKVA